MLTTDQKGAIAETAVVHETVKLGIEVLKPVNDGSRYDLVFDLRNSFVRVQCKWAPRHGDVIVVRCCSSRRAPRGFVRRMYAPSEIDAFAAYCPELDRCYFLPVSEFTGRVQVLLRLAQPRNHQQLGINWATDYELAARLRLAQGAVAQLGERRAGSAKATGSSPVGSIDSVV